jgi:hypothetical protein
MDLLQMLQWLMTKWDIATTDSFYGALYRIGVEK